MTSLFLMSVATACDVYEAFVMAEALSEAERLVILARFVEDGRVKCLDTRLSKEQVIEQLQQHLNAIYVINKGKGTN